MPTYKRRRVFCINLSAAAMIAFLLFILPACPDKNGDDPEPPENGEEEPEFRKPLPGPLKAAAAVRLLEIPAGHSHAGYTQTAALGMKHPPEDPGSPFADLFPASRGIESPATARVVVLDNGHHQIVLARLDLIYITAELTTRIIMKVRERYGINLEDKLLLNATHTHATGNRISRYSVLPDFAPILEFEPEGRHALAHGSDTYSEESMERIAGPTAEAIGEAFNKLRPARIGWGFTENHSAARDRRCENNWLYGPDYFDPAVTVLRIDDAETGKPIAVGFHYSAHGTINGSGNRNLSVDGVGHAEFKVEEAFDEPVVAIFLQGTAGDVSPVGGRRGHRGSQAMERYGWDLAGSVMEAYENISTREEVLLQSLHRWVPISSPILGYDWMEEEFHYDGALFCNFTYGGCEVDKPNKPENVLCAAPVFHDGGKYHTLLASARIDDLYLLTMPGEAVTEIGRLLKEEGRNQGAEHTIVLGFAMDHDGYILTEEDWLSGGYEPTITFWGWLFGSYIVDQSADLLTEMLTGQAEMKLDIGDLPSFDPIPHEPVMPSASTVQPQVERDLPDRSYRLSEVAFMFDGGDPALGTPEIVLERKNQNNIFEPYLVNGWRPFSNHAAHGLPLRYHPSPTYREDPEAQQRRHLYEVIWEIMPDIPEGIYRLSVEGKWAEAVGNRTYQNYMLHSNEMHVDASQALELSARAFQHGEDSFLAVLLTYPAKLPQWSDEEGSEGWQVGAFRMLDPMFAPPFVPVRLGGVVNYPLEIAVDGTQENLSVEPVFDYREELPEGRTYEPGEGPGFLADLPGSGPWEIIIPAGSLADAYGNSHSDSSTFLLSLP